MDSFSNIDWNQIESAKTNALSKEIEEIHKKMIQTVDVNLRKKLGKHLDLVKEHLDKIKEMTEIGSMGSQMQQSESASEKKIKEAYKQDEQQG